MMIESPWWWLSFCKTDRPEGQQFVGACVVRGASIEEAIREAWRLGCNPGGEVGFIEIPNGDIDMVPADKRGVLLSYDEIEAMGGAQPMFGGE